MLRGRLRMRERMRQRMASPLWLLLLLLVLVSISSSQGFTIGIQTTRANQWTGMVLPRPAMQSRRFRRGGGEGRGDSVLSAVAPRYGPPLDNNNGNNGNGSSSAASNRDAVRSSFSQLIAQVMDCASSSSTDRIPSLLGNQMPLIVQVERDDVQFILDATAAKQQDRVVEAIDVILGFAEVFVEQLQETERNYKELLGKIVRCMSSGTEEDLDELFRTEPHLTPGFLRHLQGECQRIEAAPATSPESVKMMQLLRTVQARVVEALGVAAGGGGGGDSSSSQDDTTSSSSSSTIAAAAQALQQLLGYDSDDERRAVLQAGLRVQNDNFGMEMMQLTEQALTDFERLQQQQQQQLQNSNTSSSDVVDPELIRRVQRIQQDIKEFIKS